MMEAGWKKIGSKGENGWIEKEEEAILCNPKWKHE